VDRWVVGSEVESDCDVCHIDRIKIFISVVFLSGLTVVCRVVAFAIVVIESVGSVSGRDARHL
jgi:hypothetical protein